MESLDPVVWSVGCCPKRRKVVHAVRDRAFLPGSGWYLGSGSGSLLPATPITCRDFEIWPYSVGILVKWVAFLCTLQWPQGDVGLGVGGVSFVEVLIL